MTLEATGGVARCKAVSDARYSKLIRIVALSCIAIGIAARIFHFGSIPPGLNQDEATSGYDAWCLAHFGTDSNGVRWPVHLTAWGNGGNASYAYLAIPFVAHNLSPLTLRVPMLLTALVSLFLTWLIAKRLFGETAAWASSATLSLSPWHVMMSRWALDCNLLPFLFLFGLALLVTAVNVRSKFIWLTLACIVFGVSVYSYGAAYLAVPLFLLGSLAICAAGGLFTARHTLIGASLFILTSLPMAFYVFVNAFHWNSIHLGAITIPHLPTEPRFETETSAQLLMRTSEVFRFLVSQSDGTLYNLTDPYGVLYSSIFFALAAGFVVAIPVLVGLRKWPLTYLLVPLWIIACIPGAIIQEPNANRLNLLLMGLVLSSGLALAALDKRIRGVLFAGLTSLLILFGFFARDYFTSQRDKIAVDFFDGFLSALDYARSNTTNDGGICVTDKVTMPQIYTLFTAPFEHDDYLGSAQYINPEGPFRRISYYGRYTFGLQRCDYQKVRVIVAQQGEPVPDSFSKRKSFELFDVYTFR